MHIITETEIQIQSYGIDDQDYLCIFISIIWGKNLNWKLYSRYFCPLCVDNRRSIEYEI